MLSGGIVNLGQDRSATAVHSSGDAFTFCAILDNEAMKCWGRNNAGQLGLGDKDARGDSGMGNALPTVDLGVGRKVIGLISGGYHNCAILENHSLKCWGNGERGRLGFVVPNGYGSNNNRYVGDAADEMGDNLPFVDFSALSGTHKVLGDAAGTPLVRSHEGFPMALTRQLRQP